ncbi:hypothetical protein FISHEDRAFT_78924 [Fistulina hepatica ATCC 64428]|uniref:DNA/RNA polymerase n=1 Tax=Fistulina hepatica ATCC 64428 TaxID=1128425 RepID=A0A0D7A249_9AGAR|nr:hypothetical protein FISHEDRAFT_78924 [Fistulina hepatica ATCC 64428]
MSSTQEPNDGSQPPIGVQTETIAACESVVEKFRTGVVSKARAVVEIQHYLPFSGNFDDEEQLTSHTAAIGSFLRKLDSFERIRGVAETRGNRGDVEERTLGREQSAAPEHPREETAERVAKRTHGDTDDEEEEEGLQAGRKLDTARLPWNARKQPRIDDASTLAPAALEGNARAASILRTVEILETINVDLKRAKINLLLSLHVPQFPESQWTKLLSGGTADFDQVLSGLYASADVGRTTERIGGLEFSFVSTAPSKRVTDYGDWTTAFDSFKQAFTFIFPHRGEELQLYADHVRAFFKARPVSEHSSVIAYDSSVRTRVAQRRDLLHTDYLQFQDLQIRFIFSPIGGASESVDRARPRVATSTMGSVIGPPPLAITPTSAESVEDEDMSRRVVRKSKEFMSRYAPKYARNLVWFDAPEGDASVKKESLAEASLTMEPVPMPPANELANATALGTIATYPHLFTIVTPVNVDELESLLRDHPNRLFVESVCRSLREGFWPWAVTANRGYPNTYDNAEGYRTLTEPAHLAFARTQWAAEVAAGRFSAPFGPYLLPGMYAVPMWVVPKPHSNGLRLVVDHSAGQFSLNSMIPKIDRSVHLDGLQQLGEALISARELHGDRPLVVWKSDVSHAYRILPMHPLWQIKQTVMLDNERRVDADNDFGGGGSGRIWSVFFALVLWIAIFVEYIRDLFAYVDDSFSWDFADNLVWYQPYEAFFPEKQVKLMRLWDRLRIPHERRKQEWGSALVIIGLLVDTELMSITMPDQSRLDLINALRAFAIPGNRRPLVEFQRLAGWVNWALNVYPLLRPGLNTLYAKMRNKKHPLQAVWISKALCGEILWLAKHLETSDGVYIIKSRHWNTKSADLVVFTDACKSGMSLYFPSTESGFQCRTDDVSLPRGISRDHIFYFEALAVVSAIVKALSVRVPPRRLLVWTDNTNTVDMFNSFHALPPYNPLLITVVDLLLSTKCQLRVLHVPGAQNKIADALSRFQNDLASQISLDLKIYPFIPPRLSSGAILA